jgi:CheY-like chemotaxis protein
VEIDIALQRDQPANPTLEQGSGRILVAEDHVDSRDALHALLEAHGYEVVIATDGREAVALAESDAPDIILMDVMMPVMDGLAATRQLRSQARFDRVPILALTAMEGGRQRALEEGCDDYVTKPIDLQAFFPKLRWWLERVREGWQVTGRKAG